MSDNTISLGQYVVNRYQDLKSIVKEKGVAEEQDGSTRYHARDSISIGNDSKITWGSAVDDDPATRDRIQTDTYYMPDAQVSKPNEKIETFTEEMLKGKSVITYNYLEYMSMQGWDAKAEFTERFDAKTGEKIPMPDKK